MNKKDKANKTIKILDKISYICLIMQAILCSLALLSAVILLIGNAFEKKFIITVIFCIIVLIFSIRGIKNRKK